MLRKITFALFVLLGLCLWPSRANEEVPPYQFAVIKTDMTYMRLFKTVHQGCELFVAVGENNGGVASSTPVAIATGRGCK